MYHYSTFQSIYQPFWLRISFPLVHTGYKWVLSSLSLPLLLWLVLPLGRTAVVTIWRPSVLGAWRRRSPVIAVWGYAAERPFHPPQFIFLLLDILDFQPYSVLMYMFQMFIVVETIFKSTQRTSLVKWRLIHFAGKGLICLNSWCNPKRCLTRRDRHSCLTA